MSSLLIAIYPRNLIMNYDNESPSLSYQTFKTSGWKTAISFGV